MNSRVTGLLVGVAVVALSGVILTRAGKPYGTALLTVHKLLDLAAVVFVAVLAYQGSRTTSISAGEWALLATSAVLVVLGFVSGGVVSAMSSPPPAVLWIHRVASWVVAVAVIASGYVVSAR